MNDLPRGKIKYSKQTNLLSSERYYSSERYELTDMQRRVRENYTRLRDPTWVTVSSDGTIEEVGTEVFNIVIKELTKSDKGKIEKLKLDVLRRSTKLQIQFYFSNV